MDLPLPEKELLQLLHTRSRDAYNQLYCRYAGPLYGMIRTVVQDDGAAARLLEETFVAIWKDLDDHTTPDQRLFTRLLRLAQARTCAYLKAEGKAGDQQAPGLLQLLKNKGKHEYPGVY